MKNVFSTLLLISILFICRNFVYGQVPPGFPYVGIVCEQETFARSGPGLNYYPTERLPLNSTVEIYCQLPTGWAAIRPTKNSFSLVNGRFLEPGAEPGLGKILSDNVASCIGSSLGDYQDVIQVRLRKDEPVAILEKTYQGSQVWYKIQPPSGEFRWIKLSQIIPADPLRRTAAQNQQLLQANELPKPPLMPNVERSLDEIQRDVQNADPFYRQLEALERDWQAILLTNPIQWDVEPLMARAESLRYSTNNMEQRKRLDILLERMTQAREFANYARQIPRRDQPNGYSMSGFNPDSNRYPGENRGEFAPTHQAYASRADISIENAPVNPNGPHGYRPSPQNQYGYNQYGYDSRNMRPGTPNFSRSPYYPENEDQIRALERQYRLDGIGILSPLPPDVIRQTAVRWALVDNRGNIRYYVSPAMGQRLQGYEGQLVGVNGSREYLPNAQHLHITARNIRPMSELTRF